MKSESGITATPNPSSVMWFGVDVVPADPSAYLVLSPTEVLSAYGSAGQTAPIEVLVEQLQPKLNVELATGHMSTAKAINKAHEDSGLTWEQLARVFGVSRRAVHMWATGGRMNATNAEVLMRLVDYLERMDGGPDARRAALLAIGSDGTSALDRFRSEVTGADRRLFDALPRPESLLGALHGDVAE